MLSFTDNTLSCISFGFSLKTNFIDCRMNRPVHKKSDQRISIHRESLSNITLLI